MRKATALIRNWDMPAAEDLGHNVEEFARQLGGPACLSLRGEDSSRCRVLVTLLHGNEPSGLQALHRLLREGLRPAVNLHCYVIALEAALLAPPFTHRQVPGKRDYNRCFRAPFEADDQGRVCRALLREIQLLQPEAVVDMHNTSGEGPSFAVCCTYDKKHERLVSLFTDRLILTDLKLGSIMETTSHELPVVTVECGGAYEDSSDHVAYDGLRRYFGLRELYGVAEGDRGPEIFSNPVRIEVDADIVLAYGETPQAGADLTLKVDIEHHNFGLIPEDTFLGWVAPGAEGGIQALDPQRQNHFATFYQVREGRLYSRTSQKMFMVTSNAQIARSDCLWYAVKS